ncbi:MAG: ATP-binding protein [Deltaproteobacteria bacterium]|nr:ATP-binding protein [Deltaproteobacteria bacterium]
MRLPFLDRENERRRLRRFLAGAAGRLAVVFGRRRCGKSTLLQRVRTEADLYFLADQRDALLQIQAAAAEADRLLPGLAAGRYATWDALLEALHARVPARLNVILDEFPYLVAGAPALPSMIQGYLDRPGPKRLSFVLCGSSQRMMQGLVLDRSAPLYGRSEEILKIEAFAAGWLPAALGVDGPAAIEAYSVWGGVPRYWELAKAHAGLLPAIEELVLDRQGVLHDEPAGLLLDELRTAGQAYSLLSLIGGGSNRLSEIAGRMGRPAGSLTRPLANLVELGYVRREVPFGESERTTRRTLYRIDDPFLAFHFRFVQPARSLLGMGHTAAVAAGIRTQLAGHVGAIWETLARRSVPALRVAGAAWGPASRWWAAASSAGPELDVVAESLDGRRVLVGEAKWSTRRADVRRSLESLRARAAAVPVLRDRELVFALWLREAPPAGSAAGTVVLPRDVLAALR